MAALGDFDASAVIYGKFTTYRPSTGAPFTLAGTPALSVYKDNSTTQSTSGVTLTVDFDAVTGLHHFAIDTSTDGTFYSAGSFFDIVITTGTVDSVSVVGSVVASFTIRKNSALKPTTASRTLDVSTTGEAGIDWANIGSPTTTVAFTGTTIATTQKVDVETIKTQAITAAAGITFPTSIASPTNITAGTITTVTNLTNAPTAGDLTATMKTSVTTAATAATPTAAAVTGNVGGNVTGSVGSIASGGITSGSFAADSITAAAAAADFGTELATAVWAATTRLLTAGTNIVLAKGTGVTGFNDLDAAGVRGAVGLAAANLDTQIATLATASNLATVAGYLDTEIAAILADTNELQTDWANGGRLDNILDARASQTSVDAVAGYVDTEVAAIKAVTDKVDTTLEVATGSPGDYRFSSDALRNAPTGSGGGSAPTAAQIADAVWDEILSGHAISGSTGEALSAAGGAGDPWITALPGSYSAGQAGYIVGNNLNATVSSRATQSSVDIVAGYLDTEIAAIKAKTDNLPASPAATGDIPTATQNADALLNRDMSAVSDTNARSPLNALRFIRNKWSIAGTTLTVTKEDDATSAWTATVTAAPGADPISGNDPT